PFPPCHPLRGGCLTGSDTVSNATSQRRRDTLHACPLRKHLLSGRIGACERELSVRTALLLERNPGRTGWISDGSRRSKSPRKIPTFPLNPPSVPMAVQAGEHPKEGEQQIRLVFDQALSVRTF